MKEIKVSGDIVSINGQDYYIFPQYSIATDDDDIALTINNAPIHVTWMVRKLYVSDYQAEKIAPSGEQVNNGNDLW